MRGKASDNVSLLVPSTPTPPTPHPTPTTDCITGDNSASSKSDKENNSLTYTNAYHLLLLHLLLFLLLFLPHPLHTHTHTHTHTHIGGGGGGAPRPVCWCFVFFFFTAEGTLICYVRGTPAQGYQKFSILKPGVGRSECSLAYCVSCQAFCLSGFCLPLSFGFIFQSFRASCVVSSESDILLIVIHRPSYTYM